MGLDAVEIVMGIEERFDVRFADDEYAEIRTVGDLYRSVVEKISGELVVRTVWPCPSFESFHRLRELLVGEFAVGRDEIRVHTPLNAIFPRRNRRAEWRRLVRTLGIPHRELEFSTGQIVLALGLLWSSATMLLLGLEFPVRDSVAGAILAVLLTPLLGWALQPFARTIPARVTVASLVRRMNGDANRVASSGSDGERWNAVWLGTREVVSESLSVPIEEVTYETRFIEDLLVD